MHTAAQKQIVSTLGRHTDAHAIAVHVPDGAKRRSSRHEIGSFDLNIGGGEIDLACAPWVDREKRNIPRTGFQSLNHLSGRLEADELDGQTSPAAKFSCQINRYAAELINCVAISAIIATVFLGGWWLYKIDEIVPGWMIFIGKVYAVYFLFVWTRGTLPRFRIDQLLAFAWKWMTPMALLNIILVAAEVLVWNETGWSAGFVPA